MIRQRTGTFDRPGRQAPGGCDEPVMTHRWLVIGVIAVALVAGCRSPRSARKTEQTARWAEAHGDGYQQADQPETIADLLEPSGSRTVRQGQDRCPAAGPSGAELPCHARTRRADDPRSPRKCDRLASIPAHRLPPFTPRKPVSAADNRQQATTTVRFRLRRSMPGFDSQ